VVLIGEVRIIGDRSSSSSIVPQSKVTAGLNVSSVSSRRSIISCARRFPTTPWLSYGVSDVIRGSDSRVIFLYQLLERCRLLWRWFLDSENRLLCVVDEWYDERSTAFASPPTGERITSGRLFFCFACSRHRRTWVNPTNSTFVRVWVEIRERGFS